MAELATDDTHARQGRVYLEAAVLTVFAILARLGQSCILVEFVGGSIIINGNAVGQSHFMAAADRLIDTIRIGFVTDALERHTRAVVHDDIAGIVVLVEAFGLVAYCETAVHVEVHGSLVAAHFESVSVAVGSEGVFIEESVLVGDTLFEDNRFIVAESTFLLEEHIPSVIRVEPGAASVEVVAVAH